MIDRRFVGPSAYAPMRTEGQIEEAIGSPQFFISVLSVQRKFEDGS